MDFPTQLKGILRQDVLEDAHDGQVELVEDQLQRGHPMKYTVAGLRDETAIVDLRKLGHLGGLAETGDLRKICDFLLVGPVGDEEQCYAVLLEMKVTLGGDSKPREQLRRSRPLLEYLRDVCAVQYSNSQRVELRYVIVAERQSERLDKQATRPRGRPGRDVLYKDIRIRTFVGRSSGFADLVE